MYVYLLDVYAERFCAKVVEKDDEEEEVVVHFDGWSSRYDEIIHIRDGRLRLLSAEQLAEKKKVRKPKVSGTFCCIKGAIARVVGVRTGSGEPHISS